MRRWAILTVSLYFVILLLLTAPALVVYGLTWTRERSATPSGQQFAHDAPRRWKMTVALNEGLEMYQQWGYWVWLVVMLSGQALLLLMPLRIAERKLIPRQTLLVPIIVSSFFLALIFSGAVFSILCAVFKDAAFEPFEFLGEQSSRNPLLVAALKQLGFTVGDGVLMFSSMLSVIALCWLIWLLVFYRFAKEDEPGGLMKRVTRWLVRGSILELLVAVPSHIIVRRRDDCCAPFGTFWGIVTGLSIMLLAFGPGVFFLFVQRFRRLRPRVPDPGEAANSARELP